MVNSDSTLKLAITRLESKLNNSSANESESLMVYSFEVKGANKGTKNFVHISDIGTPTYRLAKFFVPLLAPLTSNEYTIKDSLSFAEELLSFDSNLVMESFDVESLFTNIPLKETIDLCVDILFYDRTNIDGITKDYFHDLLTICMSESLVLSDGEYYKQTDGVAMGSPLGPTFANIFLCFYEQIWLENCPIKFKPVVYRRYVDDTFLLFRSHDHIEKFRAYLN